MHNRVIFISEHDDSPPSEDEVFEDQMHAIGSDYWGEMFSIEDTMKTATEGECPLFIPASEGKWKVNPACADYMFEARFKQMNEAIARAQSKGYEGFRALHGIGTDVYDIQRAYADDNGLLIHHEDCGGVEPVLDFFRWVERCEKDGKPKEYFIRGMMDYHF